MLQTTEETELTMPSDFRWHSFLVSAGYLPDTVELVPSSKHNDAIPKIEVPDEEAKSFGFSVNGISITVGRDISEEMLSKIMRAARNA